MGFLRFRRSFRILPGVRLNLSKSGVSTSLGTRGAWFTIGPRGTRTTVGIPGTGISYTETASNRAQAHAAAGVDMSHVLPAFNGPADDAPVLPAPTIAQEPALAASALQGEDRVLMLAIAGIIVAIIAAIVLFALFA
jgi:hypothetical protein